MEQGFCTSLLLLLLAGRDRTNSTVRVRVFNHDCFTVVMLLSVPGLLHKTGMLSFIFQTACVMHVVRLSLFLLIIFSLCLILAKINILKIMQEYQHMPKCLCTTVIKVVLTRSSSISQVARNGMPTSVLSVSLPQLVLDFIFFVWIGMAITKTRRILKLQQNWEALAHYSYQVYAFCILCLW